MPSRPPTRHRRVSRSTASLTGCQKPSTRVPAVEGWFTDRRRHPISSARRCPACGTYRVPAAPTDCPNPACECVELTPTPLSRRGTVWSYTENHYAPPPPYVAAEPFEPYALAAVELDGEGIVVLGQVAKGVLAADLQVGMEMQLEIDHAVPRRRATSTSSTSGRRRSERIDQRPRRRHPRRRHAPVGQVGTRLHRVRHGRRARRARRRRSGVARHPVRRRRRHHPQRLPGLHRRRHVRPEARLDGRAGVVELRRVRLGRARAAVGTGPDPRRLLRRRAGHRRRHHAEGVLRPGRRRRAQGPTPTGCASTCSARPTRSTSRSTPGAGWTSTARPPRTSRRSR